MAEKSTVLELRYIGIKEKLIRKKFRVNKRCNDLKLEKLFCSKE